MFRSRTIMLKILIAVSIMIALIFGALYVYNEVRVRKITIATNEEGSQSHDFMLALATVLKVEEPRLEIEIVQTKGSAEIMDKLLNHEADFGTAQIDLVTNQEARTVALLYPQIYHVIVKDDSDIRTPADLKGKIIATPSASGGSFASLFTVLEYYGLTEQDVIVIPFEDSVLRDDAFVKGEVDAIFRATTLGNNSIRELMTRTDANILTFDQYEAMKIQNPFLFRYEIPKGTYHATEPVVPKSNVTTVGVPTALFANSSVDPDIVRLVTQILFDHRNDIIRLNKLAAFIESPIDEKDVLPAIHAGALTFYNRDQPTFFERYYELLSLFATVIPLLASVYFAGRAFLLTRQRDRANHYNAQMATLLTQLMTAPSASRAKKAELRLLELLEDVINDMNKGDVDVSDLQAFSFVWDKAMEAVRYREAKLNRKKKPTTK